VVGDLAGSGCLFLQRRSRSCFLGQTGVLYLWRDNRRIDVRKVKARMSTKKTRSLERTATILASVYKIVKVVVDFYFLVHSGR
jgi:hypothetical protein